MIKVTPDTGVENEVDEDIAVFDKWLQNLTGDAPLSSPEKAIIKTYLAYKIKVENHAKEDPSGSV